AAATHRRIAGGGRVRRERPPIEHRLRLARHLRPSGARPAGHNVAGADAEPRRPAADTRHIPVSSDRLPQRAQAGVLRTPRTAMSEPDPFIRQIRETISDNDRKLVDALNKRLELVARLKTYKDAQ